MSSLQKNALKNVLYIIIPANIFQPDLAYLVLLVSKITEVKDG
jgi:hypothetical protein